MTALTISLSNYTPISLEEMDHVKLLDRVDTKFVIHEDHLHSYLSQMSSYYDLLMIDGQSVHPYETLYFDTPAYQLYMMHHNGQRNRYKLRCRKYINSGISYFEIKSKTNTGRTVKKRMRVESIPESLNEPLSAYVNTHVPDGFNEYMPVLRVFFERLTLVNKNGKERLTVDLNLRYQSNGSDRRIEKIVIIEVKQENHSISPFRQLMKINRQPRNYLSKYCLGITCLHGELKRNRFKQKINALNKLGYDVS
jgi:hypothetical protein